jgi:hypothetical protein
LITRNQPAYEKSTATVADQLVYVSWLRAKGTFGSTPSVRDQPVNPAGL